MKRTAFTAILLALALAACQKPDGSGGIGSEPFGDQAPSGVLGHSFARPVAGEDTGYFAARVDSWRAPFVAVADLGGLPAWASPERPEWAAGTLGYTLEGSAGAMNLSTAAKGPGKPAGTAAPASPVIARAWVPGSDETIEAHADGSVALLGRGDTVFNPAAFLPSGRAYLAAAGDACLVSGDDGVVVALNRSNLTERWRIEGRIGPLVASGDVAFWAGADGTIRVASLEDGSALISLALPGSSCLVSPAWDGRDLYVAMEDGSIAALDPAAGNVRWRTAPGPATDFILVSADGLFVFSPDSARSVDPVSGATTGSVPLPERAAARPVVWNGLIVYAGVSGRVYANPPVLPALTDEAKLDASLARGLAFKLEKYLLQPGAATKAEGFLPYVDFSPHEGKSPFTVFAWDTPADSGDMAFEAWEGDGSVAPDDAIIVLFNERGDELRSNIDEFGAHASFSHWIDPGKRYYIALGRRDAPRPPLFLRIRKR